MILKDIRQGALKDARLRPRDGRCREYGGQVPCETVRCVGGFVLEAA